MNAACTGWGFSGVPSPSMVVMRTFAAAETGIVQERAGAPSTSTVHAPHCPRPQPNLGPVRCNRLRSTYSRGSSGSDTDIDCDAPLTCKANTGMSFLRATGFFQDHKPARKVPGAAPCGAGTGHESAEV